jgi:hypothetical protein
VGAAPRTGGAASFFRNTLAAKNSLYVAVTYQPLVGIAATLIWTARLKSLSMDIAGLDVSMSDLIARSRGYSKVTGVGALSLATFESVRALESLSKMQRAHQTRRFAEKIHIKQI